MHLSKPLALLAASLLAALQGCESSQVAVQGVDASSESASTPQADTLWFVSNDGAPGPYNPKPHTFVQCDTAVQTLAGSFQTSCLESIIGWETYDTVWINSPIAIWYDDPIVGCAPIDAYVGIRWVDGQPRFTPRTHDSVITTLCSRPFDAASPKRDTLWKDSIVHTAGLDNAVMCHPALASEKSVSCLHTRYEKLPAGTCERIRTRNGVTSGRQYPCSDPSFGLFIGIDTIWRDTVVHTEALDKKRLCHPKFISDTSITCLNTRYEALPTGTCEHVFLDGGYPNAWKYDCADSLFMVWPADS